MKSFGLASSLCFVAFLCVSRSELPSTCLSDLISSSAGRCCTPQTFIEIEFTLGFGCDVPDRLDQGVRFEVERGKGDWEPIRFYTPTLNQSEPSLVHLLDPEASVVLALSLNDNNTLPVHYINASNGPVRIKEYLCGLDYAHDTVRLRWMQRYFEPSLENVSTWWLDDIRVSRWSGSQLETIMEADFNNVTNISSYESFNVRAGQIEDPLCDSSESVLYFREMAVTAVPRRSLVITHFSLNCTGGVCPPPVGIMRDSECMVTSCGPSDVRCSLPVDASFECSTCPTGFITGNLSHDVACVDANECELMTHNCTGLAQCQNTFGGFNCSCPSGYTLTDDNTCSDIDECSGDHNCSQFCNNTEGGYICYCSEGYLLEDGVLCSIAGVGFELSSLTVTEGLNVTLKIILFDNITQPLTVMVLTEDISASSDTDYTPLNQTLTFQPGGATSMTITLEIMEDDLAEFNESLLVKLVQPSLGLMITQENVTIDIIDSNDVLVEFDPVSYSVTEGQNVTFRIVKKTTSTRAVTVYFTVGADTENATTTVQVVFSPDETEHYEVVPTTDDRVHEVDGHLTASLKGGDGVRIEDGVATATVIDDDVVSVGFSVSDYEVLEGNSVMVAVELWGETDVDIVVNLATRDLVATAGDDYTMINESLTFSSGITSRNVSVGTIDDDIYEGDELFQVVLSLPSMGNERVNLTKTIANVTVLDNDIFLTDLPPVRLEFERSAYNVSEDIPPFDVCVLVVGGPLEEIIHVNLTSSSMTAQAGVDYQDVSIELTLVPGPSASVCTKLTIFNDEISERAVPEYFQLSLDAPKQTLRGRNITIDTRTVQVAIFDDEELVSSVNALQSLSPSEASERLSNLIDLMVESGREVSPELSKQLVGASQDVLRNIDGSDKRLGSRVLSNLDRFALTAFNERELPELKLDGLSLRVQVLDSSDLNESTVVGIDEDGSKIQLPLEVFERAGQAVTVASFLYSNLTGALPTESENDTNISVVSPVISTALGCGRRGNKCPRNATGGLSKPVRVVLPLLMPTKQGENGSCYFLNLEKNVWSDVGCEKVESESTETTIVCECYHLTHFAILLSPKLEISKDDEFRLQIIGYVGVSISVVCMLITIVSLAALKTLWGMRNFIHINLCICLIIAQLIFVIAVDKTQNQNACSAIAVILHYFFLAAFMWMLMEGVVLYVALVRVFIKKQSLYIAAFTIVSYGAPLLYMLLTVPLGLALHDDKGNHYGSSQACWLRYDTNFVWAFIIPVILIILTNIGFFIMAVYIMFKHQRRGIHKSAVKNVKHWLKTSIALLFVMGITWIIGVIVFHEALLFVAYIFTIFTAFQGTIIFIMFILFSKQVRENYKKWWRGKVAESEFLSKHFSSSDFSGKRGLGRFSSLRTSSFRLSKHRSTFNSSHIDTDIKLPEEHQDTEPHRDVISPEIGIEKYMMERKIELQKSTVDTRELDTLQPNGKLAPGAEHSEYLPDELNRVTIVTTAVDEAANGDCHGDYPVATKEISASSSSPETSSAPTQNEVGLELQESPSDRQGQSDGRQETDEENTHL